jgi:phage shock protein E
MLRAALGAIAVATAITLAGCDERPAGGAEARGAAAATATSPRALVESGALLLDVRTPAEFAEKHLPGAVNIPVQELEQRVAEVGAKDRPVVLYCRTGNRSARAARMLKEAGYTSVHDIKTMSAY